MDARAARAGAVFAALADPTRRSVLSMVGEQGPITATELATRLPVSRQAVVKHLDQLREAGLVESAKSGRDVRFELRRDGLIDAQRWMDTVGSKWDRRLAALQRRAASRSR